MKHFWTPFVVISTSIISSSCSTSRPVGPGVSAQELFASACSVGKAVQAVEGSVWLKAHSREFNGQFPAQVTAKEPGSLILVATNPVGGVEAKITVEGLHYEVVSERKKHERMSGFGSWGGIPLKWSTQLFLGKVPCPDPKTHPEMSSNSEGDLMVLLPSHQETEIQKYVYHFRLHEDGSPWPEALIWEKGVGDQKMSIQFKFSDPEPETRSPRKWEAESQHGSVKVRWRERRILGE